jgi:DNA-binding transcriptional MocR family regulator
MQAEVDSGRTARSSAPTDAERIGAAQLGRLLDDWTHGTGPLHDQLRCALADLVASGQLAPRTRLPSERALAMALAVSRSTTVRAYQALVAAGVVERLQGSGTWVSVSGRGRAPAHGNRLRSYYRDTVAAGRPDAAIIRLTSGAVPGLAMLADALDGFTHSEVRPHLEGPGYLPRGLPELREAIAAHLRALDVEAGPEQILVTSGAQQALEVCTAVLGRGRNALIGVENPTYRGALQIFRTSGATVHCIDRNATGWPPLSSLLTARRRERPSFLYLQSAVNNPLGQIPGADQLRATGAAMHGLGVVIDDVSTANTTLDGSVTRPLAAHAPPASVITIGTLSKIFWAGVRVGYIHAHRELIDLFTQAKGTADLGTSPVAQLLAVRLLAREVDARVERARLLRRGAQHLQNLLAEHVPSWTWSPPAGGGSLWVRLPCGSATGFCRIALNHGVELLPGPVFSAEESMDSYLRIPFVAPESTLTAAVPRLATAWQQYERHWGGQESAG